MQPSCFGMQRLNPTKMLLQGGEHAYAQGSQCAATNPVNVPVPTGMHSGMATYTRHKKLKKE